MIDSCSLLRLSFIKNFNQKLKSLKSRLNFINLQINASQHFLNAKVKGFKKEAEDYLTVTLAVPVRLVFLEASVAIVVLG